MKSRPTSLKLGTLALGCGGLVAFFLGVAVYNFPPASDWPTSSPVTAVWYEGRYYWVSESVLQLRSSLNLAFEAVVAVTVLMLAARGLRIKVHGASTAERISAAIGRFDKKVRRKLGLAVSAIIFAVLAYSFLTFWTLALVDTIASGAASLQPVMPVARMVAEGLLLGDALVDPFTLGGLAFVGFCASLLACFLLLVGRVGVTTSRALGLTVFFGAFQILVFEEMLKSFASPPTMSLYATNFIGDTALSFFTNSLVLELSAIVSTVTAAYLIFLQLRPRKVTCEG